MGLRVGGKISGGTPLVDAQLVGYVNTTLRFAAKATGSISTTTGTTSTYSYGVYLLYNIGLVLQFSICGPTDDILRYGAYATIKFFPNWALKPRNAFNPTPRFTIYEKSGSFTGSTKRSLDVLEALPAPRLPRRGLIDGWHDVKLTSLDHVYPTLDHPDGVQPDHNESSSVSVRSLLGKRADSDSSMPDAPSPGFTSQLTCPPGDSAQVKLPDLRCKLPSQKALTECFADGCPQTIAMPFQTSRSAITLGVALTHSRVAYAVTSRRGTDVVLLHTAIM